MPAATTYLAFDLSAEDGDATESIALPPPAWDNSRDPTRPEKRMPDTSVSLLDRLRDSPDAASWQRLVDLYTPLIQGWLRRQGLQPADADDLSQDILAVLVRDLPGFHRQRTGAFRSWLRTITVNRLRNFWRAQQARPAATGDSDLASRLEELEDPHSELSRIWDQEHDQHIMRRAMELIESEFAPSTWKAFRRQVVEGASVDTVAAELGLSANAVVIAKSRVLGRLRDEVRGLVD
jgi:RNA polymerase sigma factor (sigma-70 family)